jgi:hypothetical protein
MKTPLTNGTALKFVSAISAALALPAYANDLQNREVREKVIELRTFQKKKESQKPGHLDKVQEKNSDPDKHQKYCQHTQSCQDPASCKYSQSCSL